MDQTRINQFKQMAEADPDNELGHFSLGRAYLDAGQFDDAIPSLQRTLEINPRMSKGYQLLGEACNKAGKKEQAIEVLTKGIGVADDQGDRMPREAMAAMLESLGAAVPAAPGGVAAAAPAPGGGAASPGGFSCARCGRPDNQLDRKVYPGQLGEKIQANICSGCWAEWVAMGTKVINELGLLLANPEHQEAYNQHMVEFLQLDLR